MQNKQAGKTFWRVEKLETARLPHTPFLPVGRSGGPCPTVIAGRGSPFRGAEAAQGFQKATAALCENRVRVPWTLNDTTLPTALTTRSSTPTYPATIPRTSPDPPRYEKSQQRVSQTVRVCGGWSARGAHNVGLSADASWLAQLSLKAIYCHHALIVTAHFALFHHD